ncbi:hypothetical protein ACFL11_00180 [Patescibacteria group bacterium]
MIVAFSVKPVKAETSTTFPVDEAGIAAYVRLDSVDGIDISVLAEAFTTVEKQGESYVIGKVPVTNDPYLYLGLDGWLVAYFSRVKEASRIAGGNGATTLEDAINYMCGEIGVTYSTPVKYYNFEFPEANKLTLITENSISNNSFYVTVPGILYEASYRVKSKENTWRDVPVTLGVDGVSVRTERIDLKPVFYGYLDSSTYFQAGVTHRVFSWCGYCYDSKFSTVLIYKN